MAEFLDAALRGGVDVVQLREKGLEAAEELALLGVVAAAARRHGALWSVNDRADLAVAAAADVLHLGQDDLPVRCARRILGPDPLVGRSTHDRDQVDAADAEPGVDYFCVGPTWPTPTKPGRPAPGLDLTRYAAARADPSLVRHRRHRRRPAGAGARGRRAPGGGGPRDHRGGGPGGRGPRAAFPAGAGAGMSTREGAQRVRGATRADRPALAPDGLSGERAVSTREGAQRVRGGRGPTAGARA